ncbi:protein kinase [Planctomycetota bacterium]
MSAPESGDRISEYVLDHELGRGGFGVVWKAHHHVWHDRFVAIKLPAGPEQARLLKREGVLQDMVRHEHAVEVLGFDPSHDPPYLVMEWIDGESLADLLRRDTHLPAAEALRIGCEILAALAYAHGRGVVHRDLKPANVLLDRSQRVKLSDFGLGRLGEVERAELMVSGTLASTASGDLVGTLPYMAPEQKTPGRNVDVRADVYGFGILLFEMLTGARPEGGEVPSDLVPELDKRIDDVFRRCYCRLEKRFADGGEVLKALEPVARRHSPALLPSRVAFLTRIDLGAQAASPRPLGEGPVSIGVGVGAHIRLSDKQVSYLHAELAFLDGSWLVRDLGSKTGTYLIPALVPAGKRPIDLVEKVGAAPLRLAEGVTVCLGPPRDEGSVRLLFHDGVPAEMGGEGAGLFPDGSSNQGRRGVTAFFVIGCVLVAFSALALTRAGALSLAAISFVAGLFLIVLGGFLTEAEIAEGEAVTVAGDGGGRAPSQAPGLRAPALSPGRPAGFFMRAVALLFDVGLLALFMRFAWTLHPSVAPLLWLGYDALFTGLFGATAGKWLCGLVVRDAWGGRVHFGRAVVRSLAKVISLAPLGLGFFLAAVTPTKRSLHDLLSDTCVVQQDYGI